MKVLLKYGILVVFCVLWSRASAQISQAGIYFGKIGTSDIVVGVGRQDAVNIFLLDYVNRRTDAVLTGLNSSNSASGISPRGAAYSFQVRDGIARGSFGGSAFTAAKEPVIGPYASKAGGYSGVIQDERLTTSLAAVAFSALGKVLLISGDYAGVGQVSPAGQVSVPMTDGNTYSFVFRPDPLLLVAASGSISVNGRSTMTFYFFSNAASKMANISTRGSITPSAPMTAGFVITDGAKTVLIRGVGPTLSQFGVQNSCPDTQIFLFSGQSIIASNTDWYLNAATADIVGAASQVGAFALPASSRDAVLLVNLEPGAYTVQVATQGAVGGEAMVEVYQVN